MWYYINPLNWLGWFAQFIYVWLVSFQWNRVVGAIPALAVLLLMALGATLSWSSSNQWREKLVSRQIIDAKSQKQFDVAELLLKRRLRNDPDDNDARFELAETLHELDRKEEAKQIYRDLALEHSYVKAVIWLLQNDYKDKPVNKLDEQQFEELAELAAIGLPQIRNDSPLNFYLNAVRAQYHLRKGEIDKAIRYLDQIKTRQLDVGLQIAAFLKAQGDTRKAQQEAQATLARIEDEIINQPTEVGLRVLQAKTLVFMEKYDEAIKALSVGYEKTKDERLRGAIGEAIIVYSETLANQRQDVAAIKTRLRLLQQAVRLAPSNPAVLKAIADTILSTMNEDDEQIAALRESILDGTSPEIGHFVRGTAAMLRGDSDLAAIELRLAAKALPESAAILNNLAVAKTSNAKKLGNDLKELNEALELANKAIELSTSSKTLAAQAPYFHETRGQILVSLGKFEEAISDLDIALKVDALKLQANQVLAVAYDGLNQPEIAESHRAAAEKISRAKAEAEKESVDAVKQFGEQLRNSNNVTEPSENETITDKD